MGPQNRRPNGYQSPNRQEQNQQQYNYSTPRDGYEDRMWSPPQEPNSGYYVQGDSRRSAPMQPNHPQNQQRAPQPSIIPGRIVNDVKDIRPNEVPPDGTPGVFPKADASCVYIVYWDGVNGITTDTYVYQNPENTHVETEQTNVLAQMQEQLNRIENKLNKQRKTQYAQNNRKGSDDDGKN